MCVIVAKYKNVELPNKKVLKTCWTNNPDGAGFMYSDGDNVYIYKGFMSFKKFYKKLQEVNMNVDLKSKNVAIHFRIATHGGINKECTHPFTITTNYEEMKKTETKAKSAFMHNGIIAGYGDNKNNISDTMEYNKKVISQIKNIERQQGLLDSLAEEKASRFLIMTPNKMMLSGDWILDGDLYYSNYSYIEYTYTYTETETDTDTKEEFTYYNYADNTDADYTDVVYDVCDYCGKYRRLYMTYNDYFVCKKCLDFLNGRG